MNTIIRGPHSIPDPNGCTTADVVVMLMEHAQPAGKNMCGEDLVRVPVKYIEELAVRYNLVELPSNPFPPEE